MQNFPSMLLKNPLWLYYLAVNFGTALLYLLDKIKAIGHRWRIPEKTLLLPALFGGAFGGFAGMLLFRHKTRHGLFWAVNGISAAIHFAILYMLIKAGRIPTLPF